MPLPSGRGGQPTSTPVFGSRVKRKSVGPSCRSNGTALLPIGLAGFNGCEAFSSMPVPSSYSVTANVFDSPDASNVPAALAVPVQVSEPNSGTLIQRTLNALMLAKPSASTGKARSVAARAAGFRSAHAGAILGKPTRNSGTVGVLSVSPAPNVMLPFEFQKNPFHTQPAVPAGPANRNLKPPLSAPASTGVPAPSSSSPRNGVC